MLVSCSFCGRYHNRGVTCPKRFRAKRKPKMDSLVIRFRSSRAWKKKRDEIKKRDLFLCRVCFEEKYNTQLKYNFHNLEVHHIYKLVDYFQFRLEDNFLITLCSYHHKMADNGSIPPGFLLEIVKKM